MTQNTAMIVHGMAEAPERWKEDNGFITNGYDRVEINGARYGHGTATYNSTQADQEILRRAVAEWRKDVTPAIKVQPVQMPPHPEEKQVVPPMPRPPLQIDAVAPHVKHEAMADCIDLMRKAQKGYIIHHDASVLAQAMDSALRQYDATVKGRVP